MAVGRLSPFSKLDKPRVPENGTNLPPTATAGSVDPFQSSDKADFYPGGGYSDAPSSTNVPATAFGADPSLISQGVGFASLPLGLPSGLGGFAGGLAGSTLGRSSGGPLGGLIGSLAGSQLGSRAEAAAVSSIPSSMTTITGEPAILAQGQGPLGLGARGRGLSGAFGNILGSMFPGFLGATPPSLVSAPPSDAPVDPFGLANMVPQGMLMGNRAPAGSGDTPSLGYFADPNDPTGYVEGHGYPAGAPVPAGYRGPQGVYYTSPTGQDADTSGFTDNPDIGLVPGLAGGPGGIGDGGVVGGGAGVPGGAGDAGVVGDYHQGGFVELEDRNRGTFGEHRDPEYQTTEGEINVEDGEFVINKEAAGRFGPLLNKLNEIGRSQQLKDTLRGILEGAAKHGMDSIWSPLK